MLELQKENKLALLKYLRNTEEISPIEFKEASLDFDETAQKRLHIAYVALQGVEEPIVWTTADDGFISLTAEDIKDVFVLAMIRANELHEKYRTLRDRVNAAETEEELDAIEW